MGAGMTFTRSLWDNWSIRVGMIFLAILIAISIFVILTYPADFGVRIWSNPSYWADNPRLVPPAWITPFLRERPPEHILIKFDEPTEIYQAGNARILEYRLSLKYEYDDHPSFVHFFVRNITYSSPQPPRIEVHLSRPDGLSIRLTSIAIRAPSPMEEPPYSRHVEAPRRIILTEDPTAITNLINSLNDRYNLTLDLHKTSLMSSEKLFFGYPSGNGEELTVLKGEYVFYVRAHFLQDGGIGEVGLVLGGKVYGLLGTDILGRDLMMGLLYGFPVSLTIGFLAAILITSIGAFLGIMSGYFGGRADVAIQRLGDMLLNMPLLPLLIFFTFILREFGTRLFLIILVMTVFSWPGLAIIIRPMVMQMKSSQFIEAAMACGASKWWIMTRHILLNLAPFILAQSIFIVPSAILAEAALSFLGLGDPTLPTWGQILEHGFRNGAIYLGYWWWVIPPGLLIVITGITFLLITIGLEPALNPKLKTTV